MLEAVIFDMDGVISDSERFYVGIKNTVLAHFGITDVPYEYHMQFMGTTHADQWKVMSKDFHREDVSVEEYLELLYRIRQETFEKAGIQPVRGVVEFIRSLKQTGYPIAVASSGTRREIVSMLEKFGILELFDAVSSGWEVEHSKPAPDVFLNAADKLGIRPENCMVIEDAPNGAIGAKAAGMYCLGFRNADFPMSEMKEADHVFERYADISVEYCEHLMEH
ncbi:MAG TPA: HAD family phosphatase [Candidatus Fimousia stercorigallinarum]|nr:HAD family phosphatase [Candidatus Fimousia stercorigallinarum]